nr:hypothetical protein [uncultured Campylobacter sp.]
MIFINFSAGLAVGHRSGAFKRVSRQFFKAVAAGKRCESSLVRCWAVQAKIYKKHPQAEPA